MNYKEGLPSGKPWHRFPRLVVENPLNMPELNEHGVPSILVVEEEVIPLTDRAIKSLCANLSCTFDPTKEFDILNPETDVQTGATMSHMELYAVLYSLTMQMAKERDAALIVPVEVPE